MTEQATKPEIVTGPERVFAPQPKYEPLPVAKTLCIFVETWYGPLGRGGDGTTWRCGMMASVLSFLMTAQGIQHEIVHGTCNGQGHVWVETEDGVKYDPSLKQFGEVKGLAYTAIKRYPPGDIGHYMNLQGVPNAA